MRKKFLLALFGLISITAWAQDSLKTTTLKEVVVTGTKFEMPVEKSGKTIFRLDRDDLEKNAGKTLADLLNEVPGIQADGNFSTPGSNISYYVRGGRNKHTLILIDGVPMNDPSAINAEYDLRYLPLSQIESVEVLKGGLSTLYGTNASAGVINIRLREPVSKKFDGVAEMNAASFGTYSQHVAVNGTSGKVSYLVSGNNMTSKGFSSAEDNDPNVVFDKDGFSRQNGLLKLGYKFNAHLSLDLHSAYEQFKADYDAYEFADASYSQQYNQFRLGLNPKFKYKKGEVTAKVFYNANERVFKSDFPSTLKGKNTQAEVVHRHHFSDVIQTLVGINYQHLGYDEKENLSSDSTNFTLIDPYASLVVDLPSGLNIHAGVRLNTHNLYGSQFIYNLNPSFILNRSGLWRYKILASVATSYITPSLYQLYSFYGNKKLQPERSLNYEGGISAYKNALELNVVWFQRGETDPIDFVSLFDPQGNFIGGQYRNLTDERNVRGIELNANHELQRWIAAGAHFTYMDSDKPQSFYKIPKTKFGMSLTLQPKPNASISVKYNYTGSRTTFDFSSFSEVHLEPYQLVDVYASYGFLKNSLTLYGSVNNLLDEKFIAIYGYTTRGRNYGIGLRYRFGS